VQGLAFSVWTARNPQPFISPLTADDKQYLSAAVMTLRDEISHIVRCQFVAAQVETAVRADEHSEMQKVSY
jgi:hypothetical protein